MSDFEESDFEEVARLQRRAASVAKWAFIFSVLAAVLQIIALIARLMQ